MFALLVAHARLVLFLMVPTVLNLQTVHAMRTMYSINLVLFGKKIVVNVFVGRTKFNVTRKLVHLFRIVLHQIMKSPLLIAVEYALLFP